MRDDAIKIRKNRPVHIREVLKDVLADIARRVKSPNFNNGVRGKQDAVKQTTSE